MNLPDTREAVAEALSAVDGWNVRPRPFTAAPKAGDGWLVVTSMTPSTESFVGYMVQMTAVLVLSADEAKAEEILEEDAVDLFTALTDADCPFFPADISLDAQVLVTGTTATPLYIAALTFTLEVD